MIHVLSLKIFWYKSYMFCLIRIVNLANDVENSYAIIPLCEVAGTIDFIV